MRKTLTFILLAMVSVGLLISPSLADNDNGKKVTICHAAGLAGTTHYVTITISENAVYGPGGHFNENGTPQAGHEQDYFGPCEVDDTTTTTVDDTTTTTVEETTTTTVKDDTPTTDGGQTQRRVATTAATELPRTGADMSGLTALGVALVLAGSILAVRYRMDAQSN